MNDRPDTRRVHRVVAVNGGTGDPSSTRMLADRVTDRARAIARERGDDIAVTTVDLRELATEITTALVSRLLGPRLTAAVDALGRADGVVATAPVYKAEASGLFTSFFHVLDNDLLIARPVVLGATAGTSRHALVVDGQMRSLFAYLRTLVVPTSLFAASEDWNVSTLGQRVDRAAYELVLLMESGFADKVREGSWKSYQHEFGSAGGTELDVDLDSDLMRLAAGGASRPREK